MARIPDDELERLKATVSVERLAEGRGVVLKRQGKDLVGKCPFHEGDETPSFKIAPDKNVFHCLGCDAGGSVIDFVMKIDGVSFRHAVELLRAAPSASKAVLTDTRRTRGPQRGLVPKQSCARKLTGEGGLTKAEGAELLGRVVAHYQAELRETPTALEYLESRGLGQPELHAHFQMGFADRTLGYRMPSHTRADTTGVRQRLREIGVLRESGHEHFRGSIVVPLFDERGEVVQMYGRKIHRPQHGWPTHLYLPAPQRGILNREAFGASAELILCEAVLDALSFWAAGHRNVTTCYGVSGFTDELREAFERHAPERVYIAFDRDKAGDEGAKKIGDELAAMGIEVMRVLFPHGMDANDYACKVKPADKSFAAALRGAEWLAGKRLRVAMPREEAAAKLAPVEASAPVEAAKEGNAPPAAPPATTEPPAPAWARLGVEPEAFTEDDEIALAAELDIAAELAPSREDAIAGGLEPEIAARAEHGELAAADIPFLVASPSSREAPAPPNSPRDVGLPDESDAGDADTELDASQASAARPMAAAAASAPTSSSDLWLDYGDRRWRIRGHERAEQQAVSGPVAELRVNLLVSRGAAFHVDAVELYSARQRAAFVKTASEELGVAEAVVKKDIGTILLELEKRQDEARRRAAASSSSRPQMTEAEREQALEFLRSPRLLEELFADFDKIGVVGERTNKLVGYLAATSRKLDEPLAVVIQSSSAAGKSSLMDAVLRLMPEEERVQYSAMTGQSLFYMGEQDLKHKILAIVEEEGAERASYALKLLQSEGELTIASTGKDPATGKLVTHEYRVEGPVMIFLTTTASDVDEELLNRCLVLTVDEGREQTRAIHERQRTSQTLEGVLARRDRDAIVKRHRNAQRLLRSLVVVNPFAKELRFMDHATRARRDHMKYLTLIRAIALLHQHQRPVKSVEHGATLVSYIEVTRGDIALADKLAHEVLSRSVDELAPQTRRLFELIEGMVRQDCAALGLVDVRDHRFTRREVRDRTGFGQSQLRIHLERLVDMEYLEAFRGARGQGHFYGLARESAPASGAPSAPSAGNIAYDAGLSGVVGGVSAGCRGVVGVPPRQPNPAENRANGARLSVVARSQIRPAAIAKATS